MDQLILDGRLNHPLFLLLVLKASRSLENISLTCSPITVPNQASSVQTWDRFLNAKPFPQLMALQISEDLPPRQLLDFISHHPCLSRLSITPEAGHSHIMHGIPRLYNLMSLTVISGPPSYVLAILHNASHRPSLERLSLLVDDIPPPPSSIIPVITPCLALYQQVKTLEVTIPNQDCQAMFNGIALKFNKNPNIKILRISSTKFSLDPPIQDAVIIVCFLVMILALLMWLARHCGENGVNASALSSIYNLINPLSTMITRIFLKRHVRSSPHLRYLFTGEAIWWRISWPLDQVGSIGMYCNKRSSSYGTPVTIMCMISNHSQIGIHYIKHDQMTQVVFLLLPWHQNKEQRRVPRFYCTTSLLTQPTDQFGWCSNSGATAGWSWGR